MSGDGGFEISAFGCNIQAATASPDARRILDRFVFPTLPRKQGSGALPDIRIRIDQIDDEFLLFVDEVQVAAVTGDAQLVPEIIHWVDEAVIQRLTTLRAVHAGVVQVGDRVLLLPGQTHAGKSSMVAELLRRGATYFSDEYALIDGEGLAHPYPRPLLVRNDSIEQTPLLPEDFHAPAATAPARVGWIMALDYMPNMQSNADSSILPVPQSEGLMILLRNTPHVLAHSPGMLSMFERAVAGARCYAGRRGDVSQAANEILRITEARL